MKLPPATSMPEQWEPTKSSKYGVVVVPFAGDTTKHGLPLLLGQPVHILEQCGGWYRGHRIGDKVQKGIFPASHIALKPCHVTNQGPYETVEPAEGATAREVASVLREWHPLWKKLYLERDVERFTALRQAMSDLVEWRRQLLSAALTQDQERSLCLRAAARIDWGNRLLGLSLVPRTEGGAVADPDRLGPVELYRVHVSSAAAEAELRPLQQQPTHAGPHLRLSLRHASTSSLELHFALYDAQAGQFFSENFLVKSAKCGQSSFLASHAAVFMDVYRPEGQQLHLVVRVIRTGRLLGDKGSGDHESYRRPLACGVIDLATLPWDVGGETEHAVRLVTCNEADFHQLHELIVRKMGHKMAPLQPSLGLSVCLRPVSDSEEEGLPVVRMRGFPEVIMPGDVRNDLYLTLDRADLAGPAKNIEARLMLVAADGRILQDCLSGGVGQLEPSCEWRSLVLCRTCTPRWGEAVHVRLPLEPLEGAHVRVELRHCSARSGREPRLLACALLPLLQRGTVLPNGPHELPVLRADPPGGAQARHEALHLTTLLISTKLTQNRDLLALLRWKEQPDDVPQALLGLTKLDGEEIVKFLQDILDALFSMFSTADGNSTPYSGLVFKTLVYILSLLESPKFEHFKPVLDAYIKGHFAAALVYKGLLRCVVHCAELAGDAGDEAPSVEHCFASLEAVMQFVVQSRLLLSRATGTDPSEGFWADLQPMLAACERMLMAGASGPPTLAQVSLVHSLGGLLSRLKEVLPLSAVVRVAERCLAWLPARPNPLLAQARLHAIEQTITSLLCDSTDHAATDEWRLRLVCACGAAVGSQLSQGRPEEAALCAKVLGQLVTAADVGAAPALLALVPPLLESLQALEDGDPLLGPLSASLLGVVRALGESHYAQLWGGEGGREGVACALSVLRRLLLGPTFPADWAVMRALANHVALGALQELAQLLASRFLQPLDVPLWLQYLRLASDFLAQPSLQLEHLSPTQRARLTERYGDMRLLAGFQVLALWGRLWEEEGGRCELVSSLVGPLVRMTLVREAELRRAMLPLFYDLMDKDLPKVESELMEQLDELVTAGSGDEQYQQLFTSILLEEVRKRNPCWREDGVRFIEAVGHQLDRLLDYRSVMEGAENRDKRMSCTVNLLRFYREEVGRQEMFVRYVHKLCELHLPAEHYAEAAFALRLHADLLPWEEGEQGRLKEQLYLKMLHYFDRGKCWEEGLPLCKELANVYEGVLFDYEKLSTILRMHAQFLEHILKELRPEPEYFRVGFFGLGFPSFLRNKVFVYRGLAYEKVGAFSQRLQGQFPEAQLLTHNAPLDAALLASTDQYIQVCGVRPLAEPRPDLEGRPECVRAYFRVNRVHSFQFDRPVYRDGPPDRDNEFKGLWLERTTLETASALPGLLPWAEVVGQQVDWVPPLVHACEAVEAMSNELRRLVALHSREPHRPLAPLSMRLAGAIEAAVNGGLAKYHQAFLSGGDASSEGQARLRSLLLEQVHVLEGGLSLHGRLAPPDLGPLQKRLVERLGQLQQAVRGASAHGSPRPGSACSSSRSSTSSSGLLPPTHDEPWDGATSSSSSSTLADQQQLEGSMADGAPPPLPPRVPPPSEQHGTRSASANRSSLKLDPPQSWKNGDPVKEDAANGNSTSSMGSCPAHVDV
uniref:Signaling protein n=1 Tax=Rhipicephalus zambeziensis TaxID=60191 RepID=A0A224YZA8_9ACAR